MTAARESTIRVAIIDDHRSFIDGLAMVIDSQRPEMEVVGTGCDPGSLRSVLDLEPDIILLDIDLGGCSLTLLPEIRRSSSARVVMITGVSDPVVHEEAISKGARGVLLKNEPAVVILTAIKKVFEGEIWIDHKMMGRVLDRISGSDPQVPSRDSKAGRSEELTPREIEIIRALVTFEASTNKEIAKNLFISTSTLKNHLTTIYSKLNVNNRLQLMKFALSHKLAEPPE
jgi:DNA-binding NarL/FixJ family response regulator